LTHINEHNNRGKHRKSRRVVNFSPLGYYAYGDKCDNNIESNSENITQPFRNSKCPAIKKIRGNTPIINISINGVKYNDINAKGLTSND